MNAKTLVCLASLLGLLGFNAQAQWHNSLQPQGKPAGTVKLVKAAKPLGKIYLPAQASPQEAKAAAELQHWLQELTGATLPLDSGKPRRHGIVISTDPSLGQEGYSIGVSHGQLLLAGGKSRGVLNAVYALLEEDLGCRFYANDSIRLPKTNTLSIAPVARRYVPQLKIRDPFYACAFDPLWSLRNRSNAPNAPVAEEAGGHVDYDGMFVHTAAQMVPADKYFKSHPEYFAQQADGTRTTAQLCATQPEVAQVVIEYVRKTLKEHPHTEILSISKNDCQISCLCERCKKLRAEEGSDMANQLVLVNQVAQAIEADYPQMTLDTLAYLETIQVPKTMRPRKNVAIRLCNDSVGAWSRPFTPAEQCEAAKLIGAWSAVHKRLYIWDYNVNFSHYLAPMPNLDVMAANIRFWVRNHAEGVMLQGGYQGPAERDQLKSWVSAKLLWNPAWNEKALQSDFLWGHYGKAAPALLDYEQLLEHMRTEHAQAMANPAGGIRYPMDAPYLSKSFLTRATELFAQGRGLAQGEPELMRRVERAQLPILYVQCMRGAEFCGEAYPQVVADFERIGRREQVQFLEEGSANFEAKLAQFKSHLPAAKK